MANEIKFQTSPPIVAGTIYAAVRDSSGLAWNGSALVPWVDVNIGQYAIPLTQQGASGYWVGDFPTALIAAGVYEIVAYQQVGGTQNIAADSVVGTGEVNWPGVATVPTPPQPSLIPADPIVYVTNTPGLTDLFARVDSGENSVNKTTGALQARTTATLANFLIPLSDSITAATYLAAMPPGTPAGRYSINIYETSAGGPGGYALVGADYARFDWNGVQETPVYAVSVNPTDYNVVQDVYAEMGQYNAELAGTPDNTLDAAELSFHLQCALDTAAAQINFRAKQEGNYDVPLTQQKAMLKIAGRKYAAYETWQIRGLQRNIPDSDFLQKKLDADKILDDLFWLNAGGFVSTGADASNGMAGAGTTVQSDGCGGTYTVPCYHRPFWGWQWFTPGMSLQI